MYKQIMKLELKPPKGLSPILRKQMGREAIKIILDRTSQGRDVNGNSFVGYSPAYRESEIFQDRQKGTQVNLRLWGDMLESLRIEDENSRAITIGFSEELEAAKAHGHNTGGGNLPERKFFALSPQERNELTEKYTELQKRLDSNQVLDDLLKSDTVFDTQLSEVERLLQRDLGRDGIRLETFGEN